MFGWVTYLGFFFSWRASEASETLLSVEN